MFSCERVSKGLAAFDFNWERGGVHNWDIFRAGVALLQKDDRFLTVGIDTVDAAYEHCKAWTCNKLGIDHPGDLGYGKGWNAVKSEFTRQLYAIQKTGRGIVFTSHSREVEITSHSGASYTRIQPSMPGQAFDVLKALTDFVFYADYLKDRSGHTQRVLITEGDEIIEAKQAVPLPRFMPMPKGEGFSLLEQAFAGEDVGYDPVQLSPVKETTKTMSGVVRAAQVKKTAGKKKVARRR